MARLVAIQQPQATFHKDEGGKTNNLSFRVMLQGDIDVQVGGAKGEIPLLVVAVYEDGTEVPRQDQVITITGCTEKPSGDPCLCLVSGLGGVLYRLKRVSKRLDDRAVCVRVSLKGCPEVPPLQSEGTKVFSKRKNREQREEEQAREKEEMERREAEAASRLVRGTHNNTQDSERASKFSKIDPYESADGQDTDDGSMVQISHAELRMIRQRLTDLEASISEHQKVIDELTLKSISQPLTGGIRSTSQAAWGISHGSLAFPNNINLLASFPPALKRDTSMESLPDSFPMFNYNV